MPYVISRVGEEYNDEINVLQDGGTPVAVVQTKEQAKKICAANNRQAVRGLNLNNYCYDIEDIAPGYNGEALKKAFPFLEGGKWELTVPATATDEQIDQLLQVISLDLYYFVEVEEVGVS